MAKNWHDKIFSRLVIVDLLGKGETPKAGEPRVRLRIDYTHNSAPKGWIELASNLLTSLLFAAIHGDAGTVGLARFLGSILMCRLFERTGAVWAGLGAHATFNCLLLLGPTLL